MVNMSILFADKDFNTSIKSSGDKLQSNAAKSMNTL